MGWPIVELGAALVLVASAVWMRFAVVAVNKDMRAILEGQSDIRARLTALEGQSDS